MPAKKKPSILIVDSDTHLAEIFAKRFTKDGWIVRTAKSIAQAKKMLARKSSDVIFVDPLESVHPEKDILELIDKAADRVQTFVIHTAILTREAQILWKRLNARAIIRKGEQSLSAIVKKIKKVSLKHI